MGLASVIQKAAQVAFKAIGDIPLMCTYTSRGTSGYAVATGTITSFDEYINNLSILFEDYNIREVQESNGLILTTDKKAYIPSVNMISEVDEIITPKASDTFITTDEVEWTVQKVSIDSAKALWILQIRRSA